jgi:hypothetical protein
MKSTWNEWTRSNYGQQRKNDKRILGKRDGQERNEAREKKKWWARNMWAPHYRQKMRMGRIEKRNKKWRARNMWAPQYRHDSESPKKKFKKTHEI